MTLKQFLKPDWRKISLTMIFLILTTAISVLMSLMSVEFEQFEFLLLILSILVIFFLAFPFLFTSSVLWILFSVLVYWYLLSCLIFWIWDWKRSKKRFNWIEFGKIFLIVVIIMIIVILIGFVLSPPVYTGPYVA